MRRKPSMTVAQRQRCGPPAPATRAQDTHTIAPSATHANPRFASFTTGDVPHRNSSARRGLPAAVPHVFAAAGRTRTRTNRERRGPAGEGPRRPSG
eukprot:2822640-Prymnesium_polylepis.3